MISTSLLLAALLAAVAPPASGAPAPAPALPTASLTTITLPTDSPIPTDGISPVSLPTATLPTTSLPDSKDDGTCPITVTDTHIGCVGMTSTIYPSTVTSTAQISCGACAAVTMVPPLIMCPAVMPYTTITVKTASTSWTTECASSTTYLGTLPGHKVSSSSEPSATVEKRVCTTTFYQVPPVTSNWVYTSYEARVTSTSSLPCGGCELAVVPELLGPAGPQHSYSLTVTAPVVTATAYGCMSPEDEEAYWDWVNEGTGRGS